MPPLKLASPRVILSHPHTDALRFLEKSAAMEISLYSSIDDKTDGLTCLSEPPALNLVRYKEEACVPRKRARVEPAPGRSLRSKQTP